MKWYIVEEFSRIHKLDGTLEDWERLIEFGKNYEKRGDQ